MTAIQELLDKAKEVCLSDAALGRRMGLARATVSMWRTGQSPMPQDRVVQVARIARENEGYWLARVEAEQSLGDTRKAWERVAAVLPRVAMITLILGGVFAHYPAAAQPCEQREGLNIMRSARKLREICANFTRRLAGSRHGYRPSALLA